MTEIERLLEEHNIEVNTLRDRLKDVLEPEKHDELWLLRYILSNKTAAEAETPARFAIEWTTKYKNEIEAVINGAKPPKSEIISQFQVAGEHKSTVNGDPIFIVRVGLSNPRGLMDAVSYEEIVLHMILFRMRMMHHCHVESKKRGRLVKTISVLDFQNTRFTLDSRFAKLTGETSKLTEQLFPQLLGKSIFINVPTYILWTINLIKPLMSKRAVEKMTFCPALQSGKDLSACPFVSKFIKAEDVPTFLGGKCQCTDGCIGGIPNSQTTPVSGITSDGYTKMDIPSRSEQTLEFPVAKDVTVTYGLKSESKKMRFELWFEPEVNSALRESIVDLQKSKDLDEHGLSGTWTSPTTGMVKLKLDNTNSLLLSASMSYKMDFNTIVAK